MKSFLFGLGLGIGLGVLFAPMSGQDTRDNLTERANDLASSAKETADGLANSAKATASCLANSARETVDQGRERIRSGVSAVCNIMGAEAQRTGTEGSST